MSKGSLVAACLEYVQRLCEVSPGVARILTELDGRNERNAAFEKLFENHYEISFRMFDDERIPIAVRAMVLALLMEPRPTGLVCDLMSHHYPGEESHPHKVGYAELGPRLQELAWEVMKTWPVTELRESAGYWDLRLVSWVTQGNVRTRGLNQHLVGPLLWAIEHGPDDCRDAFVSRLPWFMSDVTDHKVRYPGHLELLQIESVTADQYRAFDRNIRTLIRGLVQKRRQGGWEPASWPITYLASVVRTLSELSDEKLTSMLADRAWQGFMAEQLLMASLAHWNSETPRYMPSWFTFACIGKLERVAVAANCGYIPTLLFQEGWYFRRMAQALIVLLGQNPDSVPVIADVRSADARRGIELIASRRMKIREESRLLLVRLVRDWEGD